MTKTSDIRSKGEYTDDELFEEWLTLNEKIQHRLNSHFVSRTLIAIANEVDQTRVYAIAKELGPKLAEMRLVALERRVAAQPCGVVLMEEGEPYLPLKWSLLLFGLSIVFALGLYYA